MADVSEVARNGDLNDVQTTETYESDLYEPRDVAKVTATEINPV